jgi:2-polyprenyl-3-methyl-5-hydroxy-6-metoxy-1,4-benzoquinol methylase
MINHWDKMSYPRLIYVETTNFCNARCGYCLYERMERPLSYMTFDQFKFIADKVKARGLMIGAMFCFGEPLSDAGLFKKIRYAKSIRCIPGYMGLNTNCSLLTSDKYQDIIDTCNNMTLSFVNTGSEFEKLTRLKWDQCYSNAIEFIKYRDANRPDFKIQIGCNDVSGHDRRKVQKAFDGYKIAWARDAEIKWGGKIITGVIDRSMMYHTWVCDGYKGAMQIKPNGDCCFCAYDVIRDETKFANIFTDSWDAIEKKFKQLWRQPSSLCLRCDFWHNYEEMVKDNWSKDRINNEWKKDYDRNELKKYWEKMHTSKSIRYLSGYSGRSIWHTLSINGFLKGVNTVLNIGVGLGMCTRDLALSGKKVYALDVSEEAIQSVKNVIVRGFTDPKLLPSDFVDMSICHLVAQHMNDFDLIELISNTLRCIKPDGILAIQFASPNGYQEYSETIKDQCEGTVRRTFEHIERVVNLSGGKIIYSRKIALGDSVDDPALGSVYWTACHIKRDHLIKTMGL